MPQTIEPVSAKAFGELLACAPFLPACGDDGQAFALAVSGGPDSMAMAVLFSEWHAGRKDRPRVPVLIVDHGLRPESGIEANQVRAWLEDLPGLAPQILRWSGPKPRSRVQESARDARYRLLESYCCGHKIPFLFMAHHRDDLAETFLLRLAGGSGIDGLSCMAAAQRRGALTVLRPFLDLPKESLVMTCRGRGMAYVEDPSNAKDVFARARVRKSRAILEKEGLSAKRLAMAASRMARGREALDFYAACAFEKARTLHDKTRIGLNRAELAGQPAETRFRVITKALKALDPGFFTSDIRMQKLESLVADLFGPDSFRRRTLGGFVFGTKEKEGVIIIEKEKRTKHEN